MTDLERIKKVFDEAGVAYDFDAKAEGWGLPEYQVGYELDYPPYIQEVSLGCSNLYFDNEGKYLGWWNSEFSIWNEPRL